MCGRYPAPRSAELTGCQGFQKGQRLDRAGRVALATAGAQVQSGWAGDRRGRLHWPWEDWGLSDPGFSSRSRGKKVPVKSHVQHGRARVTAAGIVQGVFLFLFVSVVKHTWSRTRPRAARPAARGGAARPEVPAALPVGSALGQACARPAWGRLLAGLVRALCADGTAPRVSKVHPPRGFGQNFLPF